MYLGDNTNSCVYNVISVLILDIRKNDISYNPILFHVLCTAALSISDMNHRYNLQSHNCFTALKYKLALQIFHPPNMTLAENHIVKSI